MGGPAIAIVGMACEYPDAGTPLELFESALAGRRAFRRIPDQRLPLAEYGSSDPGDVDATTVRHAALIEGWSFDRLRFKTVGSTYRQADLTHWLALDVADRALTDAGFEAGDGLPRERTGVVLGNTLTGEFSRAQALRLRWPYVRRVFDEMLRERMTVDEREALLAEAEARYKAPFEPFGDESLAGGLANTIAGRICNYYDLHGGGFTVDGACASSLLAVSNACAALVSGDLDVALAGGVDLSLDPFELVGFARAGALAHHEMRVYDRRAEGFWPGEGCGVVVLMREEQARAQGRRVHAKVRGWGIASDGAGGISRPERAGQRLALQRAYRRAELSPASVGYFEGHGTGTAVGDATELAALEQLLREAGAERPPAIASIKAHIGHTKAAAGIAGLIRASCALEQGVLPSLPGCERPRAQVDPARGGRLRVLARAESWEEPGPRRAGVSSMGFGGIDTHVVLEAAEETRPGAHLSARHATLADGARTSELLLLTAPDRSALHEQLERLADRAAGISRAQLGDLSVALAARVQDAVGSAALRAALVAATPEAACAGARRLLEWLDAEPVAGTRWRLDAESGCFLGSGARGRIGWLFPGQAAPVRPDLGGLEAVLGVLGLEDVRERHRERLAALGPPPEGGTEAVDTGIAQPAIVSAALAGVRALEAFGVEGALALGHSVGELAALAWSGALSDADAIALATERGRIVSERAVSGGGMVGLAAPAARAELLAKNAGCCLAGVNGPRRAVAAGARNDLEMLIESARDEGVAALRLPVSHAFHSPHMAPCVPALRSALEEARLEAPARRVISSRTALQLGAADDLREHLLRQLTEPVRFAEAAEAAAAETDLLIEVGPGGMLSSLTREFLKTPVIGADEEGAGQAGLLRALGAAWALGAPLRPELLRAGRAPKPFDLDATPRLFSSPCGLGVRPEESGPSTAASDTVRDASEDASPQSALDVVRTLAAERCELPVAAVSPDDRFLSDLHLTSIAVSELAARAARALDRPPLVAPSEFADATVGQLAEAVESEERSLAEHAWVPGVDAWVRAFEVVEVARPEPRSASQPRRGPGHWRVFAPASSALAEPLRIALEQEIGGEGVLVHLPEAAGEEGVRALLAGARAAFEGLDARSFVLVHHGDPAVAVARSLHQEARSLATRIVEVEPDDPELVARVLTEVRGAASFGESRLERSGARRERRLRALPLEARPAGAALGRGDVLLVTGGGKGIAAECAWWLAKRSGCRLALVGRARPGADAALDENLARLAADGVAFEYASADVCDADALRRAVARLEDHLGPVTALLHGAGRNEPRSLASLEPEHVRETLAPKRDGLRTLLEQLGDRLRCVVGFGSVVAQIGLPGEAHYALANEALAREIERFAMAHPQARCLAVEWSVWSGVGMGDRLGRVEVLAAQNISPISPDEGCAWLEALLGAEHLPVRVFLSGRFGAPPTLAVEETPLPIRRFVEHVREHTPGVELVVDVDLSHESDPWLADHVYRGQPLVPGVFALEAMTQVARALQPSGGEAQLEDVRFLQPLLVPPGETCRVRIAGLVRSEGEVELALRAEATGFAADHVRGRVCCGTPPWTPEAEPGSPAESLAVALDPTGELYDGELFFHGRRFERVRGYEALHWDSCRARIEARDEAWFGAYQPQALELGDPGARDAAVHAVQACLPHLELLPVGVERVERRGPLPAGELVLDARERSRGNGRFVWDLALRDADGTWIERWHGLTLRAVERRDASREGAPALLAPRLEELAARTLSALGLRAAVVRGADHEATARALAVACGRAGSLRHRGDGKPLFDASPDCSASHAAGLTLGVVAEAPVGCDLEAVAARDAQTWRELLGAERFQTAVLLAERGGEALDVAATRVWGAAEALRKLGAARETPLLIEPGEGGSVALRAGRWLALSWYGRLRGVEPPLVATLVGSPDARL